MSKTKEKKEEVKLVVFGSGGVGKSCLIVQLIQNMFVESYDPTLEDSYRKDVKILDKPFVLDILDTAGQEEFHSLRDQYIRNGEGFLIIYSVTSRSSFEEVNTLVNQILSAKEVTDYENNPSLANELPIIIVGNKCDLVKDRKVTTEEGSQLCQKYGGLKFFDTSAKTRQNVDESFLECGKQVIEKVKMKKKKDGCLMM
jgi:small GTP-binding protein